MRAPMILPWVAKKAGISEELALKLWRRAAGEAERMVGNSTSTDYYRLSIDHFLSLAQEECVQANASTDCNLTQAPRLTWAWRHQDCLSRLSMMAGQNAYRRWQDAWQTYCRGRKAA